MGRFRRRCAVLVISGLVTGIAPAAAQFGGIFGDPPRPPSNVPSRPQAPVQQRPVEQRPIDLQQTGPGGGPASIQTQPLPPPPGVPVEPAALPAGPQPGLAPNQRQQRGAPQPPAAAPQQAVAPPPNEEVVIAPPAEKVINPTAVFSGLDKITGRITSFDVAINETVQFGALQVTPRVCYTRKPTDTPNTDAFVEVDEVTLQGEVKRVFTGWMFAASPGLHGVEHPIYDVWLSDCKGGATPVAEVQPAPTRPAPAQARPAAPRPQRPAPPPPRPGPPR